jgi:hypothetical protein
MMKSRGIRWAGNEACVRQEIVVYRFFLWEPPKERDHWGYPGIDGRIILRQIFRKWDVGVWT